MNIETQVAIFVLLHIIPIELSYGNFIFDVILSKVCGPTPFPIALPFLNIKNVIYLEVLVVSLIFFVPESVTTIKSLLNQNDNELDQVTLTQESLFRNNLSLFFDLFISAIALETLRFLGYVYFASIKFNLTQYSKGLPIPFSKLYSVKYYCSLIQFC